MTDNNEGENSQTNNPNLGTEGSESKNKYAKMTMDQAFAEVQQLRKRVEEKDSVIADLTEKLEEANKVLEGQEKGRLIGEIIPRSTFQTDDLWGKSLEELKSIRATLDQAIPPKVNSVRFGVMAADQSDRQKGLTVGDLSFCTAQKRKGA